MASALVPQIVRSGLRPLRDALKREEHRYMPEEVRELRDGCSLAALLIDQLWEATARALEDGLEGGQGVLLLKESTEAVEESLWMFARVRAITAGMMPSFGGQEDGLALLERLSRRAGEVRAELAALLAWLDTPRPQLDPATLGRRDSPASEGYEQMDDVLARLRTGGDV